MSTDARPRDDELPEYTWAFSEDPDDPWIGVLSGGGLPCQIEIRIGVEPRGQRLICTGLRVGVPDGGTPHEITKRMLQQIGISDILRAIRMHASGESGDRFMTTPLPPSGLTMGEMLAQKAQPLTVRRGMRGLEPETLRTTAELYRDAVERGELQPRVNVALELGVDPSTVWRRLRRAWELFPELRPEERDERDIQDGSATP